MTGAVRHLTLLLVPWQGREEQDGGCGHDRGLPGRVARRALKRFVAGAAAVLAGFRRDLYRCLTGKTDALFELADAIVYALTGPVTVLVDLPLAASTGVVTTSCTTG